MSNFIQQGWPFSLIISLRYLLEWAAMLWWTLEKGKFNLGDFKFSLNFLPVVNYSRLVLAEVITAQDYVNF